MEQTGLVGALPSRPVLELLGWAVFLAGMIVIAARNIV